LFLQWENEGKAYKRGVTDKKAFYTALIGQNLGLLRKNRSTGVTGANAGGLQEPGAGVTGGRDGSYRSQMQRSQETGAGAKMGDGSGSYRSQRLGLQEPRVWVTGVKDGGYKS
jgi:hypothetical protein